MERESGFYWVRYRNVLQVAEWFVGELGSFWLVTGGSIELNDCELDEIGERIERKESE